MESKFRMLKRDVEERQVATEILKKEGEVEVREWLLFDGKGEMELVEAGKDAIMRRTGLSACDLDKLLDPLLSYPSIFLGRERAFIINLEHVKAIITAKEFLLLNSGDPSITPFVYEFQAWILRHYQDSSSSKHYAHPDPDSEPDHNHDAIKILPFEFVALESCLEASGRVLENEVRPSFFSSFLLLSTISLCFYPKIIFLPLSIHRQRRWSRRLIPPWTSSRPRSVPSSLIGNALIKSRSD